MAEREDDFRPASRTRSLRFLSLSAGQLVFAGAMLIVFSAVLAYEPALHEYQPPDHGGFILDDDTLLTENSIIRSSDGLYKFWCTSQPLDYWPLTNTTFWLEWRLWGTNAAGYHVTNVTLHIVAGLLLWTVLRMLSIPGAFLAALLFTVHPVNVESVAWISQRKNGLAMVFFLLSIVFYLRAEPASRSAERRFSARWYRLSLFAFVLAMLSKGSVAILPLVLLLILWWRHGRLTIEDIARSLPFFLLAAVLTAVNVWFQTHASGEVIRSDTIVQRLAGAGAAIWFYLSKAILPLHLLFIYPQWRIEANTLLWWFPVGIAVLFTAALWLRRRTAWGRPLLLGWAFFCVALAPILGFIDVGFMKFSLVADHYEYIAMIGVLALVAASWSLWQRRYGRVARWSAILVAVGVVGLLTFLTRGQSRLYANAISLYSDTLKNNPDSWLAHNNLGKELFQAGQKQAAIEQYQQALRLSPNDAEAQYNLGVLLFQTGRPQAAIEYFREAVRLNPDFVLARYNLGTALFQTGHPREAIEHLQRTVALKADFAEAHNNLGNALLHAGQPVEAIEHLQEAVRLKPDSAEACRNLGNALAQAGRLQESIEEYKKSLHLEPDHAETHNNLGAALVNLGHVSEAIEQFQEALKSDPKYCDAWNNLALASARLHRSDQAVHAAHKAIDIAKSQGQNARAEHIQDWLNRYQTEQMTTPENSTGRDVPAQGKQ
jgi:tetratricopeptide (TPR) repeat protein